MSRLLTASHLIAPIFDPVVKVHPPADASFAGNLAR